MSATVTSFCRSTKRLSPLRRGATLHIGCNAPIAIAARAWSVAGRHRRGIPRGPRRCPRPRARRRARRRGRSGRSPRPAGVIGSGEPSGTNVASAIVVAQTTARLRKEVDRRIPAAGHADEIAFDATRRAARQAARRRRASTRSRPCARAIAAPATIGTPAARARRGNAPSSRAVRARIDDRRDGDAGARERERGGVRAVVVREHDGTRSRSHRIAIDVRARGAGEQRAGQVVVRVGDAALVRARREHDGPGAHLPQPLARRRVGRSRERIGDALDQSDEIAVVVAERRGARQQRDVGTGGERSSPSRRSTRRRSRRRRSRRRPRGSRRTRDLSSQRITRAPACAAARAAASPAGPAPMTSTSQCAYWCS